MVLKAVSDGTRMSTVVNIEWVCDAVFIQNIM